MIYLFIFVVLGLHYYADSSLVMVGVFLIVMASLVLEHRFWGMWASLAIVPGL